MDHPTRNVHIWAGIHCPLLCISLLLSHLLRLCHCSVLPFGCSLPFSEKSSLAQSPHRIDSAPTLLLLKLFLFPQTQWDACPSWLLSVFAQIFRVQVLSVCFPPGAYLLWPGEGWIRFEKWMLHSPRRCFLPPAVKQPWDCSSRVDQFPSWLPVSCWHGPVEAGQNDKGAQREGFLRVP